MEENVDETPEAERVDLPVERDMSAENPLGPPPTKEEIEHLAYRIWKYRGGGDVPNSVTDENYLEAENFLMHRWKTGHLHHHPAESDGGTDASS